MKLNKMVFDDKKIEAAANKHIETEYARYNSGEVEEEMICLRGKDSFKAGAKWAINELMKNLWHPNTKEPDKSKSDIITLGFDNDAYQNNLKNPSFGMRNLGDIRLADAKSSSGLIYLTYCQSRKEVSNEDFYF